MGDMDKAAQAAFEKKLADIMQLYNALKFQPLNQALLMLIFLSLKVLLLAP